MKTSAATITRILLLLSGYAAFGGVFAAAQVEDGYQRFQSTLKIVGEGVSSDELRLYCDGNNLQSLEERIEEGITQGANEEGDTVLISRFELSEFERQQRHNRQLPYYFMFYSIEGICGVHCFGDDLDGRRRRHQLRRNLQAMKKKSQFDQRITKTCTKKLKSFGQKKRVGQECAEIIQKLECVFKTD